MGEFIYSIDANCQYCYKCLRNCQVKAISFNSGKSRILEEECILCGNCLEICPQKAKNYRRHVEKFKEFFEAPFMVSVAPSFFAHFDYPFKVIGFLKSHGATVVNETAVGADLVSERYKKLSENLKKPVITTACPVVVDFAEMYYPELSGYLASVVSPAVAHQRFLKKHFGDLKTIFLGPCIAKKRELEGIFDLVLTFEELNEFFESEDLHIENFTERFPDPPFPENGRLYPMNNGINQSVTRNFSQHLSIEGIRNVAWFFENFSSYNEPLFIELSACYGSCLEGPAIRKDLSILEKRNRIFRHKKVLDALTGKRISSYSYHLNLKRETKSRPSKREYPESAIQEVLLSIGKDDPSKELNCGACGYNTCREKAAAVLQGKAEKEMCITYLIDKVSSVSNLVVEETPNIILIYKDNQILYKNRVARNFFKNLSDSSLLEIARKCEKSRENIFDLLVAGKSKRFFVKTFELPEDSGNVVILVDMTKEKEQEERIKMLKKESLEKIEDVLSKQMMLAQEIAGLLGESIAEAKSHFMDFRKFVEDK
ncbi:ferredoxin [Kosmotoga arenicorallina S304]|uniref:Ferredoxin n=1 Tax=Kosmotoga arenicorallina S304 TaxID=1453497 RepID=A0A176JZH5_9BACT|nr:[Fe-Fe] hydrogenase large subunit C-terminal domain-containing protein [Kosmotoga arenicorallina]OAA29487.1 ferredoxin [Kosmotoga arenicorallina S304]